MDKLDEWMKREELSEKSATPKKTSNSHTEKRSDFKKKKPNTHAQHPPRKGVINRTKKSNTPKHFEKSVTGDTLTKKGEHGKAERSDLKNNKKKKPVKNWKQQKGTQKKTTQHGSKPHTKNTPTPKVRPPKLKSKTPTPKKLNKKPPTLLKGKLKIVPLGGLNEVGKNMMILEYEDDIILIDMGFEFPSDDLLGIDYVIPDISYLEERKKRIRGVVLTHGHLDHIGGIPYILPKLDFPPLFGTKLTMGLVKKRVEEFKQEKMTQMHTIDPDKPLKLGRFLCNFFRVAHSIPDAVGVSIDTPVGKIVHTGDFKFDSSPGGNQKKADLHKLEELGKQNVLALFSDSTNALKKGHTMSESQVGKALEEVFQATKGRIIIASFSSLIGRIQQILDHAKKYNRKVFVSGRSMQNNIEIAARLGHLKFPANFIQDIKKYKKVPDEDTLILTTGSQGESLSALTRIANGDHPHIKIKKNDTIVLSSSPIIGNERPIATVVNNLCLRGAKVIHNQIMDVHTSGHAQQDELIQMINYVKPKYFLPIHGEYFMRKGHAELANEKCGIPESNIIMLQNGDVLIGEKGKVAKSPETVETKYILIDGLGEGTLGSYVQSERKIMSENGSLTILVHINRKTKRLKKTPDIVSRGFIYMHETNEIAEEIAELAGKAYKTIHSKNPGAKRKEVKKYIKQSIDKYTREKLARRPLIVPLIIEN